MDLLLVEDRIEDAELTMMALEKHSFGNKIVWVRNGEEALEYLHGTGRFTKRKDKGNPRVILLDLQMPKMSGVELLELIKEHEQFRNIPVVVLTTSKESTDVKKAYDLGANSYIVKPVAFDKFVSITKDLGCYWLLVNETC